jgi:6-pyruvoyl-tetrahydropterin synthase
MPAPSLFLNDFTVLDFAFVGEAGGVFGGSFFVSAELFGELDEKDFLLDFSRAKKALKALVDEAFDHKLLIPTGSGSAKVIPGGLEIRDDKNGAAWTYECPREAFELFPDARIDAGVIAYHLARLAKTALPANVREARFHLTSPARLETEASFRYTHGLRFHDGNCQRLFHGHRNPVEVWIGGARSARWETALAAEWSDAHFVALPTLKNRESLDLPLGRRQPAHPGVAELEYTSGQGVFRARLPAARVVLTESEPSIETMAKLGLSALRALGLEGEARVVAYEGLNKGSSFGG